MRRCGRVCHGDSAVLGRRVDSTALAWVKTSARRRRRQWCWKFCPVGVSKSELTTVLRAATYQIGCEKVYRRYM